MPSERPQGRDKGREGHATSGALGFRVLERLLQEILEKRLSIKKVHYKGSFRLFL